MSTAFYGRRSRTVFGWSAVLVLLVIAAAAVRSDPNLRMLFPAAIFVFMAAHLAAGLWRRSRPLVEISDDAVDWQGPYGFARPKSIALREVVGVEFKSWHTLRLKTRDGESIKILVGELRKSDRQAVREAIEQRLS